MLRSRSSLDVRIARWPRCLPQLRDVDRSHAAAGQVVASAQRIVVLTGRRHLHRLRHPRLPWPERARGPRTRRRRRRRDIRFYLGDPEVRRAAWQNRLTTPAWTAEPNQGHAAIVELERRSQLHGLVTQNIDGLHQKAGNDARQGDRGPRHGVVHPLLGLRRSSPDGAGAGTRPRRRCRSGLSRVRRHPQERHDQFRAGAGSRGHRPGHAGERRVRRDARRRLDAQCVPGGQLRAPGQGRRRSGDHRQR